jgi:hypothetical protein
VHQEYANPVRVDSIHAAVTLFVDDLAKVVASGLGDLSTLVWELEEQLNPLKESGQPVFGGARTVFGDVVERGFGLLERTGRPLDPH